MGLINIYHPHIHASTQHYTLGYVSWGDQSYHSTYRGIHYLNTHGGPILHTGFWILHIR